LKRLAMTALTLIFAAVFVALGVWQLERRVWKLGLIAAVDARIHAPPAPAPQPRVWTTLTAARDAYRHVRLSGRYLNDLETHVEAVTDLGPGYWVLTPLKTEGGFLVLVNRGYVPDEQEDPASRVQGQIKGPTQVVGLLRMTEPGGGFLRRNDPKHGRWYSRDVAAMAAARGLKDVAPYFVDAETGPPGGPVPGLTVVRFPNNHLLYAVIWFALGGLSAGGAGLALFGRGRDGLGGGEA
jgi:surfeit locus 1 family protein